MALLDVADTLEAASYLTRFWRFVGSARYRAAVGAEWRRRNRFGRALLALDAALATAVGLLPLALVWRWWWA